MMLNQSNGYGVSDPYHRALNSSFMIIPIIICQCHGDFFKRDLIGKSSSLVQESFLVVADCILLIKLLRTIADHHSYT